MNRLQLELNRLCPFAAQSAQGHATAPARPDDREGALVLVLQLAVPVGWERLSSVWQGVQSELELPPPAIAVSGGDGLQLWFFLAAPVPHAMAAAFLEGLRARYLPDVDPTRVRMTVDAAELPRIPPVELGPERWSAFVAPDLAAVFEETPWLDIPPTDEGQAALLRAVQPMPSAAFEAAWKRLVPGAGGAADAPASSAPSGPPGSPTPAPAHGDPVGFLAGVMQDETAPLALRIDAAKALLPYVGRP